VSDQPADGRPDGFVLPSSIPDRESVDGWRRWRLTRHAFVPASQLSLAAYRVLSSRQRQLHDLLQLWQLDDRLDDESLPGQLALLDW
jgi:hypothetical protein